MIAIKNQMCAEQTSGLYFLLIIFLSWCIYLFIFNFIGVITLDASEREKHSVMLDVMPLINGFLPLPLVRLSKYIPADVKLTSTKGNKIYSL